jgi:hypothetical protein
MKISEVISMLEKAKTKVGDVEVMNFYVDGEEELQEVVCWVGVDDGQGNTEAIFLGSIEDYDTFVDFGDDEE